MTRFTYTIKSKKLQQNFEFSIPGNEYIYVDIDGHSPGTLGQQICKGGGFTGSTLSATSEDSFIKICRNWYRAYMKNLLNEGL